MARRVGLFSLVISFFISGCSGYMKRKQCESINWYNHGQRLAQQGQRINEDNIYRDCKKAEADIEFSQLDLGWKSGRDGYCTSEGATNTGKKGQPLNLDLCDLSSAKTLKERHASGVRYFCHPKNALSFGASGEVYNQICPEEMEEGFLSEYKKGRRKFLEEMARQSQQKQQSYEQEIRELERKKTTTALLLAAVPASAPQQVGGGLVVDPNEERRSQLLQQVQSLDQKMSHLESNKRLENSRLLEYQRELNTMETPQ